VIIMGRRDEALCLVGSLALALCACGLADDGGYDEELDFRTDDGGVPAPSGRPSGGGWISNGLEDPDVSGVDPAHGLSTAQGMAEDMGLLGDTDLQGTAEYLVECALPLGESITKTVDGQTLELDGLLGLAPQWQDGACDEDCQQWVSACLLARTNVSGQSVTIWIQADHPAIGYGIPEGLVHEASWYGNLFAGSDEQYLCKGEPGGAAQAKHEGRTCSSGQTCGFTKYGKCNKHDRCTMAGPDDDVPIDCVSDVGSPNPSYHTISSYLED
jgi:hypothetical protein